jgi:hypothetical protein
VDGKDNIKIFLKNITDFISLCQDGGNWRAVVEAVMNLRVL